MAHTIVVGIDGSEPSDAALRWALHRAGRTHASVVLEHIVDERWAHEGVGPTSAADDGARILADAVDRARALSPETKIEARLVRAVGDTTLASGAEAADLLVIGTHKTGFVRGRVLGTKGLAFTRDAPCSVAVIPEDFVALRQGVLVGIADEHMPEPAIRVAAVEARDTGQPVTLLHASELGRDAIAGDAPLTEGVAVVRTVAPLLEVHRRHLSRRPAEALLDAARRAALLVLGAGESSGQLGSVALEVLLNITSPVLIVRGEGPDGAGLPSGPLTLTRTLHQT